MYYPGNLAPDKISDLILDKSINEAKVQQKFLVKGEVMKQKNIIVKQENTVQEKEKDAYIFTRNVIEAAL